MDKVDFLPERIKIQRAKRTRLKHQSFWLTGCVLLLAVWGYIRQDTISSAKAELRLLNDRSSNIQQQLVLRASLERQQNELLLKKRVDDDLGSRIKALDIISEMDQLLPESMAFTDMKLEVSEIRIPIKPVTNKNMRASRSSKKKVKKEKVVKRIQLKLKGVAPTDVDVANFIGQLSASPLFEDVNMGYVKTVDFRGRAAREFQASCFVIR